MKNYPFMYYGFVSGGTNQLADVMNEKSCPLFRLDGGEVFQSGLVSLFSIITKIIPFSRKGAILFKLTPAPCLPNFSATFLLALLLAD